MNQHTEEIDKDIKKALNDIYLKAVNEVNITASYQHWLVYGEIKVIRKEDKPM